jgi:hypothetical protein
MLQIMARARYQTLNGGKKTVDSWVNLGRLL